MGHPLDTHCREVFVKAVCAKGRATAEQVHTITPRAPVVDVLGCRAVGLRFKSRLRDDSVRISGEYELQVWVAFNEDSELIRQRVDFSEEIGLRDVGEGCLDNEPEVLVDIVSGPDVAECSVNKSGQIEVVVTIDIRVDVVGKTRLFVQTCKPGRSDGSASDDDWDWTDDHSDTA
ncbi:MAG TPA: outer spore coat protein CotE [Bacillota bacterium]